MAANSAASIEAPPTKAPSTSGWAHNSFDVGRLHRPAVQHPDVIGQVAGVELGQPGPDRTADLLGVLGRRDLAGADRPHRLVRHHGGPGLVGGDAGEGTVELGEGCLLYTSP